MFLLRKRRWKLFLAFVVPTLLLYSFFVVYSIGNTIYYSLTDWDAIGQPVFKGLKHYRRFLTDPDFQMVMKNTLMNVAISMAIQVPMGLVGAYLIYRTRHMYRMYRFLVFIPVVMSASAIALCFTLIFNTEFGPLNNFLSAIGLSSWRHSWLSDAKVVYYVVMTPMTYQYIGLYVIIQLSGMQSIPEENIESAAIDGANSFQVFAHIIVPMQRSVTAMCVVLIITGCFKAFEHSYIMTWGGPGYASSFLGVYMYTEAFIKGNYGRGSAVATVILFGSLLFTIVYQTINARGEREPKERRLRNG